VDKSEVSIKELCAPISATKRAHTPYYSSLKGGDVYSVNPKLAATLARNRKKWEPKQRAEK